MPKIPIKRPNPHWLENVELTNDLVYQYQVDARTLSDVLNADLYALTSINQVRTIFSPKTLQNLNAKSFSPSSSTTNSHSSTKSSNSKTSPHAYRLSPPEAAATRTSRSRSAAARRSNTANSF